MIWKSSNRVPSGTFRVWCPQSWCTRKTACKKLCCSSGIYICQMYTNLVCQKLPEYTQNKSYIILPDKDTPSSLCSTLLKAKPNSLWFDQWQHMLLNAAITEFKLHAFSLVQTTSGFCKLCRTGSPVYHVVFNHVFLRLFGENLVCPCSDKEFSFQN